MYRKNRKNKSNGGQIDGIRKRFFLNQRENDSVNVSKFHAMPTENNILADPLKKPFLTTENQQVSTQSKI